MAYSYFTTPTNGTGRNLTPIGAPAAPAAPTSTPGIFGATPTQGQGAFGLVPGQIGVPAQAQQNIQNDLSGLVSPEIMSRLQNQAARFGVTSGMPGSGLQWNSYLHDYLGAGQAAQQRGFENYKSLLPLAERNAELAAAPDPTQRAQTEQSFAQQMFDKYLSALRGPAGGTGNYRGGGGVGANPAGGTIGQPSPVRTGGIPSPEPIHTPFDISGLNLTQNWGELTPSQQRQYLDQFKAADKWQTQFDPTGDIFGGDYPSSSPPPSTGQTAQDNWEFDPELWGGLLG